MFISGEIKGKKEPAEAGLKGKESTLTQNQEAESGIEPDPLKPTYIDRSALNQRYYLAKLADGQRTNRRNPRNG